MGRDTFAKTLAGPHFSPPPPLSTLPLSLSQPRFNLGWGKLVKDLDKRHINMYGARSGREEIQLGRENGHSRKIGVRFIGVLSNPKPRFDLNGAIKTEGP